MRALLRRDRNHPSVIMWSVGNEVGEQGSPQGGNIARELVEICREEDPTRPTVTAMNSASPTSAIVPPIDLVGLNYQGTGLVYTNYTAQYPIFHARFPDKLVLGSETTDAYSSRGYYTFGGSRGGRPRRRGERAPGQLLRPRTCPLVVHPGHGVCLPGQISVRGRRVRLDGLRLFG